MLTNIVVCAYDSSVSHNLSLRDFAAESQIGGHTSHRVDGLRALAKMIASDLLTKHRNKTNKKRDRKVSDPQILEGC